MSGYVITILSVIVSAIGVSVAASFALKIIRGRGNINTLAEEVPVERNTAQRRWTCRSAAFPESGFPYSRPRPEEVQTSACVGTPRNNANRTTRSIAADAWQGGLQAPQSHLFRHEQPPPISPCPDRSDGFREVGGRGAVLGILSGISSSRDGQPSRPVLCLWQSCET
jgi:hypothetical protein